MKKEIKEEIIAETETAETVIADKIVEGSNVSEILDEVEKSSENLESQTEPVTESTENVEAVKEEVVKDEDKSEEKEINLLKEEVKELKANILEIVEILAKTITEQTEVKSIVNKIPVRKGLINYTIEEKKSDLSNQIDNIRKSNFII